MRILILGHSGLLGSYLGKTAEKRDVIFMPEHRELNIKDSQKFFEFLKNNGIELCINASGMTNIFLCETNVEEAFKVNSYAPAEAAKICAGEGVRFIHISTGFVFDGKKDAPYLESDEPGPINAYGASKYRGELFVLRENPDALVIRTDEIFGRSDYTSGHNVLCYMVNQIIAGRSVALYNIRTSPTYGHDLALFLWSLKERGDVKGILHAVNSGACTYAEAAEIAAKIVKAKAVVRRRSDILRYKIPENCSLKSERFKELNLREMRPFEEALKECMKEFL